MTRFYVKEFIPLFLYILNLFEIELFLSLFSICIISYPMYVYKRYKKINLNLKFNKEYNLKSLIWHLQYETFLVKSDFGRRKKSILNSNQF